MPPRHRGWGAPNPAVGDVDLVLDGIGAPVVFPTKKNAPWSSLLNMLPIGKPPFDAIIWLGG